MALVVYDRVQQTGTANTTVSFTLSGSVTGYQSFAVVGNGNTTYYGAVDASGNWEVGLGTYSTSGPTLTRTTILSSSSSNTAVSTFSGSVNIFVTYPAEDAVYLNGGNVSSLGTITSGTWSATTIAVASGGTGVTTSASNSANSVVLRDANVNIAANNTFNGITVTTAASLTTTMTAASSFYQKLTAGTGGQTFKLPDATTVPAGATYIFDNDSSGTMTIQDNAGGAVDTIQPGSIDYIFLEAGGTVAGSWSNYALIPDTYDFNTTTASFGNAAITNATWSATAITSAFGGTGLTTFSSSNYALYSTSPSILTAGTLPVLAGGTGVTTSTGSGSNVLNTSPTLVTPTLGAASASSLALGSALAVTYGGTGVTSSTGSGSVVLNTSPSLVTPTLGAASATSLALGSALTVANGGTGQTSASSAFNALSPITTTGDLIIGTGVNTSSRLGIGSSGYTLTSNGTTAAWAAPAASGATITPTTSNTTYYVIGTPSTSGTNTADYISNTNVISFNASTGALTAVSMVSSSDERLKQDIETITDALTKVETMRGVTYLRNGKKEIGVIAQEVERVIPEVVQTGEDEYGYKSVAYGNMVGLLIEAVKELSAEVKALKAQIKEA